MMNRNVEVLIKNNQDRIENILKIVEEAYKEYEEGKRKKQKLGTNDVTSSLYGDIRSRSHPYRDVILPMMFLCILEKILKPTKDEVLAALDKNSKEQEKIASAPDTAQIFENITCKKFYNISNFSLDKLVRDKNSQVENLLEYLAGFSENVQDVFDKFGINEQIDILNTTDNLDKIIQEFCNLDLQSASDDSLVDYYKYLVQESYSPTINWFKYNTLFRYLSLHPRVSELIVSLIFGDRMSHDNFKQSDPKPVKMLDPACAVAEILTIAKKYHKKIYPNATLKVYGQEESVKNWALSSALFIMNDTDFCTIKLGNSFADDKYKGETFEYLITNATRKLVPIGYGDEQREKTIEQISRESRKLSFLGRFGIPYSVRGEKGFLFLQHIIAKMKPAGEGGSRLAIIFDNLPIAEQQEGYNSEVLRWVIENDWLETIVALPSNFLYDNQRGPLSHGSNNGAYILILTNRKSKKREGCVQLLNAHEPDITTKNATLSDKLFEELCDLHKKRIEKDGRSKILPLREFGEMHITLQQPIFGYWKIRGDNLKLLKNSEKFREIFANRSFNSNIEAFNKIIKIQDICLEAFAKVEQEDKEYSEQLGFEERLAEVIKDILYSYGLLVPARDTRNPFGNIFDPYSLTREQVNELLEYFWCDKDDAYPRYDQNGSLVPDPTLTQDMRIKLHDSKCGYSYSISEAVKQHSKTLEQYLTEKIKPKWEHAWIDKEVDIIYRVPITDCFHIPALMPEYAEIRKRIERGETRDVEFKERFRIDYDGNKNRSILEKNMKTIASFLNSEGGELFIGVDDNKRIIGIEEDLRIFNGSRDGFDLAFYDLLSEWFGPTSKRRIALEFFDIESKTIARVEVRPSKIPVFIKFGEKSGMPATTKFFRREGSSTKWEWDSRQQVKEDIKSHWPNLSDGDVEKLIPTNFPNP